MMKTNGAMTISDVAARTGVPPKTIRYYEDIRLIKPPERLENRYRTYGEADVQTLRFIHRARNLGFSLKDISALLVLYQDRARASREVKRLALDHVDALDRKIAELTAIRNAIADLAKRCRGDDRPDCPILDDLDSTTH
jgi:MerR family copper efflux transcriptional regulator